MIISMARAEMTICMAMRATTRLKVATALISLQVARGMTFLMVVLVKIRLREA